MDHDTGKGQQWFIIKQKRKILSKENLVLINKILEFRKDCKSKEIQRDIFISLFGPYTAAGSGKSAKCHKRWICQHFYKIHFQTYGCKHNKICNKARPEQY